MTGSLMAMDEHKCLVCGKADCDKAACFRGTDWCCENHRKVLEESYRVLDESQALNSETKTLLEYQEQTTPTGGFYKGLIVGAAIIIPIYVLIVWLVVR
jgi:hypothetical protein